MNSIERIIATIGLAIFALLCLFLVYLFLVWMPVAMYAEGECLRAGYPKYSVTVGLERYCLSLDGAVTVKVHKP